MGLTFGQITIDCDDAADLAGFWAALLDREVDDGASDFFATVGRSAGDDGRGPVLMFLRVPEAKVGKNRVHIDLHDPDWKTAALRAVELGATRVAEFDEFGTQWATLLDPEGNEFDIGAGLS
jgi:hypothetical protein